MRGDRATIGTVVALAEENMSASEREEHQRLRGAEDTARIVRGFKELGKRRKSKAPVPEAESAGGDAPEWPEGLYSGDEFVELPTAPWIVEGAIRRGSTSVAPGQSQAGKTSIELPLALAIAMGHEEWAGLRIVENGPVLWIAAEGQDGVKALMREWCAEYGHDLADLFGQFFVYERRVPFNTDVGEEMLDRLVRVVEHETGRLPVAVWADTLRKNMRGSVSKDEIVDDVLTVLDEELTARGIAYTLLAHTVKGADGEAVTKGSGDWEQGADNVRRYTGKVRDGRTVVAFDKVKMSADGWALEFRYEDRGPVRFPMFVRRHDVEPPAPRSDRRKLEPLSDDEVARLTALRDDVAAALPPILTRQHRGAIPFRDMPELVETTLARRGKRHALDEIKRVLTDLFYATDTPEALGRHIDATRRQWLIHRDDGAAATGPKRKTGDQELLRRVQAVMGDRTEPLSTRALAKAIIERFGEVGYTPRSLEKRLSGMHGSSELWDRQHNCWRPDLRALFTEKPVAMRNPETEGAA